MRGNLEFGNAGTEWSKDIRRAMEEAIAQAAYIYRPV